MAYKLLDKNGQVWKEVTISSDSFVKQDFMDMMGWTEEEFRKKTVEFVSDEDLINKAYNLNSEVGWAKNQLSILWDMVDEGKMAHVAICKELNRILEGLKTKLPERTLYNGEMLKE